MKIRNKKSLTTILLALLCVVSMVILVFAKPIEKIDPSELMDLNELIETKLIEDPVIGSNYRTYKIEVDSSFTRTVYRVPVPPSFSKTVFHFDLHKSLTDLKLASPAKVLFPEKDMNIYVYDGNTIRSTIRLITTEPQRAE
ncbi:hypothetical protein [Balneola vulgaris]|uniref:hypothetical protein n=1 Tax=Balneola vulgaris TaxID=287535 RepID=UPI0004778EAA|nr:hypothetical protein [Balneola vulgaris]